MIFLAQREAQPHTTPQLLSLGCVEIVEGFILSKLLLFSNLGKLVMFYGADIKSRSRCLKHMKSYSEMRAVVQLLSVRIPFYQRIAVHCLSLYNNTLFPCV